MQNVNVNKILDEISVIKQQIEAAQVRLAALEAMLQQAQQAQVEAQEQRPEQQAQAAQQPAQVQGEQVAQPEPAPQPEPKEEFEYEGDPDVALKIINLVVSNGKLRVSAIRWYLSLHFDIRLSEADVICEVKTLERLGALKGVWSAPGIVSRSAPIMDPWAEVGPEFVVVRRRLRELLNERR